MKTSNTRTYATSGVAIYASHMTYDIDYGHMESPEYRTIFDIGQYKWCDMSVTIQAHRNKHVSKTGETLDLYLYICICVLHVVSKQFRNY